MSIKIVNGMGIECPDPQGFGSFWSKLESVGWAIAKVFSKWGPAIAAVASVIPAVGPALAAGVLAATAVSKMALKAKKGELHGMGARTKGTNWDLLEVQLKALAIYNHERQKKGQKIWEGTWDELKAARSKELKKVASGAKKRMLKDAIRNLKSRFDLGVKQVEGASRSTIQRKLPGYPKMIDLKFKGGVDWDKWRKIVKSADFNSYAKEVRNNLIYPSYSEYWQMIDKKGGRRTSEYYENLVEDMVESLWTWMIKRYMLHYIGLTAARHAKKTFASVASMFMTHLSGGEFRPITPIKRRRAPSVRRRGAPPKRKKKKAGRPSPLFF